METLRECSPSLLRTTPDRENGVHLQGSVASSDVSTTRDVLIEATEAQATVVDSATPAIDCTPRFTREFVDPLFPCREVRYAASKRAFDVLFSVAILAVLWPFMVIIAALIKLTSRGPVFFKQVRVGKGGRYFYCYKFRSMCVDAEAKKEQLMHLNEADGPVFKIKRDPRITPIGSFLRKFSLDELPQFINVLKGEMSIVGPRPPIPAEVDSYGPHERQRLAVVPGLTCIWQVSGRSSLSFERWVELDLQYIETMSFSSDLKIVLKTIPAVLMGSGAH